MRFLLASQNQLLIAIDLGRAAMNSGKRRFNQRFLSLATWILRWVSLAAEEDQ
jgi:hypothetical protein